MDGSEALAGLILSLTVGRELDPSHQEELAIRLLKVLRDGTSLDDAFGLKGPGRRNLKKQVLVVRRNHHLKLALAMIEPELEPWPRCKRLAKEIRRFAPAWKRTKHLPAAPDGWPPWKQEIWSAKNAGMPLPSSPDSLFRLLARTPPYSCKWEALIMASAYL